jgi:hypothetical protein
MGDVIGIGDVLGGPSEPKRTTRSGYIYALRFSEGVVKIGMTVNGPTGRAKQWRLWLLAYVKCKDARCAERKVHKFLAKGRQGRYELFRVSLADALQALDRLVVQPIIVQEA